LADRGLGLAAIRIPFPPREPAPRVRVADRGARVVWDVRLHSLLDERAGAVHHPAHGVADRDVAGGAAPRAQEGGFPSSRVLPWAVPYRPLPPRPLGTSLDLVVES